MFILLVRVLPTPTMCVDVISLFAILTFTIYRILGLKFVKLFQST